MFDNYSIDYTALTPEDDENEKRSVLSDLQTDDDDVFQIKQSPRLKEGDLLPILPLRGQVLFPGVLMPITIGRKKNKELALRCKEENRLVGVFCQLHRETQDPGPNDLYEIGTAAEIRQIIELPNDNLLVLLRGDERVKAHDYEQRDNIWHARMEIYPEQFPPRGDREFLALASVIKKLAQNILDAADNVPDEAKTTLSSIDNPPTLVNYICVNFGLRTEDKYHLLTTDSLMERGKKLQDILSHEVENLKMHEEIQAKTQEEIDRQQREYYLNHQMEVIQKELGDTSAEVV